MAIKYREVEELNRCAEEARACVLLLRATKSGFDVIPLLEQSCNACENLASVLLDQSGAQLDSCNETIGLLRETEARMAPFTLHYYGRFARQCCLCILLCEGLVRTLSAA